MQARVCTHVYAHTQRETLNTEEQIQYPNTQTVHLANAQGDIQGLHFPGTCSPRILSTMSHQHNPLAVTTLLEEFIPLVTTSAIFLYHRAWIGAGREEMVASLAGVHLLSH